jgi:phage-related minor tail protein
MSGVFDLGSYGAEILLDTTNFINGMRNADNQMGNAESRAKKFAGSIGTLATGAIAGLGAALVGATVVGVKMGDDLQKSLNKLQASTGATDKEMKGMESSLKNIYNAGYGEDFNDIAQSMSLVKQNTGLAGKALEDTTKNALTLRDTFEFDVNESSRTAQALMKQFGITSDQAFNLIAQGAQNGANKNGDLLDSLNEYAPQFKSMGFSAEEFTNVLIDGAKNGAFSIDKVGDAVKEFNIRSKDGSKASAEGYALLGLNAKSMTAQFAQGGDTAQQAFTKVMTSLNAIEDPVKKNTAGVALFGTQFEDLEAQGIAALGNIGNTASLSKDALGKISEVKFNSLGDAFEGIKRNLQTAMIEPMQKHVLPLLSQFSKFIISNMPQIKSFISTTFEAIGKSFSVVINITKSLIGAFSDANKSSNSSFTKVKEVISTTISTVKSVIGEFVKFGTTIWSKYGDDIVKYAKTSFGFISKIITGTLQVVRGIVKTVLSLLTGDFKGVGEGLKLIVSGAFTAIVNIIKQALFGLKSVFKAAWELVGNVTSSALLGLAKLAVDWGKDIVRGLVKGLGSMIKAVTDKAKEIANSVTNTIKKVLKIHSPSKETEKLGEHTGDGFAKGLSNKQKKVEAEAKKVATAAKKGFEADFNKINLKLDAGKIGVDQAVKELEKLKKQYASVPNAVLKVEKEIKQIQEQTAKEREAAAKKREAEAKKQFKDDVQSIKDRSDLGKISLEAELKQFQTLMKTYKGGSAERIQLEKEIARVKDEILKSQFDKEKAVIDKKKFYNELSLTQELALIEKNAKAYKKGSEEREYYEREAYRVKKEINDKLVSINDEYANKIKETNNQMLEDEKRLRDEYQKTLEDRTKSLYSFVGLFDEISLKSEITGAQLVENLRGQVNTFKDWTANISALVARGLDEGLLKELQDMGPQAAAEIAALNSLSDPELNEYVKLWREKHKLAKEQATDELEEMKYNTEIKISELKKVTQVKLEEIKIEWGSKLKEITTVVKNEFSGMPDIGKSAVAGLISGIESMMPSLKNTASEIAGIVRSIIQGVSSVGNVSSPTSNKSNTSTNKNENASGTASTMNGGIAWFANGGIFNKASIVGLAENGHEAILPLQNPTALAPFADAVYNRLRDNLFSKSVNNNSTMNQQDISLQNTFHFDVKTDLDEKGMRRVAEFVSKQQINTLKSWGRM